MNADGLPVRNALQTKRCCVRCFRSLRRRIRPSPLKAGWHSRNQSRVPGQEGVMLDGAYADLGLENLFDTEYYATSHGNNNIMPGAPRQVRIGLTSGF